MKVHEVKKQFPHVKDVQPYNKGYEEYYDVIKKSEMGITELVRSIDYEEEGAKEALLMVCYDDFVIDGVLYENHVAIVLNDIELIYFAKNPYNHKRKPYIVSSYNKIPNQIYGTSLIHHALPSAEFIDKSFQIVLDAARWSSPVFVKMVNDPALQKLGNFKVSPNSTIPMTNPNSLSQLQVNVGQIALLQNLIQIAEKNIQDVTGANPMIQGEAPQQGRVTAFEIDARVQGTNSRFQSSLKLFNNEVLEPFMEIVFENDRQYKVKSEYINGREITVNEIRMLDFDWTITSLEATLSKAKRIAQHKSILMEVVPAMFQTGLASPPENKRMSIDHVELFRKFLVDSGYPDVDLILQEINIQQAAQQNAQQLSVPGAIQEQQGANNVFSQPNQSRVGADDTGVSG
jgi:hypothetical protein